MTRSGYSDDLDWLELGRWRGRVMSALRGRRGQALLRDIAKAMDAMPERVLGAGGLKTPAGDFCTLGCAMAHRGLDVPVEEDESDFDVDWTAGQLDIAECLAMEVTYINDECGFFNETGEQRWRRVRKWVAENLRGAAPQPSGGAS